MQVKIEAGWQERLKSEFQKDYFSHLIDFVKQEYQTYKCYPPGNKIFAAFDYAPFEEVKVVIIGQDPYHGDGQANGLCFSVNDGIKSPPSLVNIFKELRNDLELPIPQSGNLERWAKQGILMLNATLTVRANAPASHQNKGWETFTDSVIQTLNNEKEDLVFILWGAYAQKKKAILDVNKHHIIESAHPSPFSADRGFFGSKPFSKTNKFLAGKGLQQITW